MTLRALIGCVGLLLLASCASKRTPTAIQPPPLPRSASAPQQVVSQRVMSAVEPAPVKPPQTLFAWFTPSPTNNSEGYDLLYGEASRVYTRTQYLGSCTWAEVTNLSLGKTYYFVAASRLAGKPKYFSNEVRFAFPTNAGLLYVQHSTNMNTWGNVSTNLVSMDGQQGYWRTVLVP